MIFKPCFYGKIAQDSALSFMKENSCNPSPNYSFKALMKIATEDSTASGYVY